MNFQDASLMQMPEKFLLNLNFIKKMKKLNYLFFGISLFCLGSVIYLFSTKEEQKTAYFLSAEVYNQFDYKLELEMDLQNTQDQAKKVLDSMELDLEMHLNHLKTIQPDESDIANYEFKQRNYMEMRNKLETGYSEKSQDYYNKIWDRINGYVQEFGNQKGYAYIFGANGDGSIMYAEETNDITPEIVEMINKKYAGEI